MTLHDVIGHVRDRPYMNAIERDRLRIKATGEIFTPTPLVQEVLDTLPTELFSDPNKTFLDNSCGDGQFLGEILIRKLQHLETQGIAVKDGLPVALETLYGVDLMQDNVDLCRERLLCGQEQLRPIVEKNIYQADGLQFSYEFRPMSSTRQAREQQVRNKEQRAKEKRIKIHQKQMEEQVRVKIQKKLFGEIL
jgi:hypothetical protein